MFLLIQAPPGTPPSGSPLPPLSDADWERLQSAHRNVGFSVLAGFPVPSADDGRRLQTTRPFVVPDRIKALDGRDISVDGYMLPFEVSAGGMVEHFYLNASFDMCSWGAQPKVNERIDVQLAPGRATAFTHLPLRVYGRLRVREERDGGEVVGLYRMEGVAAGPPGLGY